jgi:hypothetical protein
LDERFRDHALPDEATGDAMPGAAPNWDQQLGYDVADPDFAQGYGPGTRMMGRRRAQEIVDPASYITGLVEALARATQAGGGIAWRPEVLTGGKVESAVITPETVVEWIATLDIDVGRDDVEAAAISPSGLKLLGDGLVLAGVADLDRIVDNKLVVWRRTNKNLQGD